MSEEVDLGQLQIHKMLVSESLSKPALFDGFIHHWGSRKWSPFVLANMEALSKTKLICRKPKFPVDDGGEPNEKIFKSDIEMENDGEYITCSFREFLQYVDCGTSASKYPTKDCSWVYADYKYMKEIFQDAPQMLKDVDWSVFGFYGRDGTNSTFWMGTGGANTPCHFDTYGCNLVAQLFGKKKWTLFPPSESENLYPTRIPFEESSVFSQVDIKNPDQRKFPLYKKALRYEVTLEPGQVLYVPKHWWHFVECESTAISVNTWIELESDRADQIKEGIAAMLTKGLLDYAGQSGPSNMYNPKELPLHYDEGMKLLNNILSVSKQRKAENHSSSEIEELKACECCRRRVTNIEPAHTVSQQTNEKEVNQLQGNREFTFHDLLDCLIHQDVLEAVKVQVKSRFSHSLD